MLAAVLAIGGSSDLQAEDFLLERLFELLFKYRPVVFELGEFAISPPWPAALAVLAVLLAGGAAVWSYRRMEHKPAIRSRGLRTGLLIGLRLAALALLLFCLLRPVLILRAVEPQRNFLAVLIDDSRSMAIADRDGVPRSTFVGDTFGASATVRAALANRFALRFFRFSASTDRISQPDAATFSGTRSHIGQALKQVADELAGLPASGIVLVTDGADTSAAPIGDTLRSLKAAGLPVFTVGVGRDTFVRDVQVGRVDPPRTVLKGATLVVDVVVSQTGYVGQTAPLIVEQEGQIIGRQDVTLPPDGQPSTVRVRFTLAEAGPRLLRFRVPPLEGEQVTQNNVREALIIVEDRREKLLYIEGAPRFEMKFLRQAVADDKNLQVVTLQRTAQRKFFRLDVDAASDLAGGFPRTREELFAYRGLILGSIEASAFTPDQLRMIGDFVSVRGGGMLALGGRHSFGEGGYAGTPVADALPVEFEAAPAAGTFLLPVQVRPTPLGDTHVATQIADTEKASSDRWKTLPALTAVNPIRRVKPGAAVLLTGGEGAARDRQIVLAFQRYGAGKALALPVQDSWLWKMHADISVDDTTHEILWRRLLRWVVDAVPDRIEARLDRERVEPGEAVTVVAKVRDAGFLDINDAAPHARVVSPSGQAIDLPMEFLLNRHGEYRTGFVAKEAGLYEVRVDARRGRDSLGGAVAYLRSAPDDGEYFDAAMRAPLLKRIAEDTGGRFYAAANVGALPEEITYLGKGVTAVQEKELWDMPMVLILLVGFVGGEWFLRRQRGLA